MLRTRLCELLEILHPVVLGGMGSATDANLAAAVSKAGGLGIVGCVGRSPAWIAETARAIRDSTDRPFGLNLLLFETDPASVAAVLDVGPSVFSTAWAWPDQGLRELFSRAHDRGAKIIHMVSGVPEARRAAEAGADAICAQGTEGGGHVGLMGTLALVPQVARAPQRVAIRKQPSAFWAELDQSGGEHAAGASLQLYRGRTSGSLECAVRILRGLRAG